MFKTSKQQIDAEVWMYGIIKPFRAEEKEISTKIYSLDRYAPLIL
jgi:hypothetical protein